MKDYEQTASDVVDKKLLRIVLDDKQAAEQCGCRNCLFQYQNTLEWESQFPDSWTDAMGLLGGHEPDDDSDDLLSDMDHDSWLVG